MQRNDEQMATLRQFVAEQGDSLLQQAAFDALHTQQVKEDEMRWGQPAWPKMYRNVDSPEMRRFYGEHRDDADFYLWLQWLAYSQSITCWEISQGYEMPASLCYGLAVGVAEGGAEIWCDRELYCLKASVGAPPNILGPLGQNWGLPPMGPRIITARAYGLFTELLRANIQNYGTLRVDHVMLMLRLWWVSHDETTDQGAYVHHPVDDLLSILAPESKRHRCMVIDEDFGTVPAEIVGKLCSGSACSYKVFYFEDDHEKTFRAPKAHPEQSMAVTVTHDLPTLRGYRECGGLILGKTLGLYPDEVVLCDLYQNHEPAEQGPPGALCKYGHLSKRAGYKISLMSMTPTLNRGLQRYIADSNSVLLGLQPEDWLDMVEPVNIPGTSCQYKNWRHKLPATLESMFADDGVNKLLKGLSRRRGAVTKKKQNAVDVGYDA